jgi:hypothetical protein
VNLLTAGQEGMSAMDNELFDYSPIGERPPVRWPGGARVAFYIGARYLDQALALLGAQPGIWLTTSDEIAEYYRQMISPQP